MMVFEFIIFFIFVSGIIAILVNRYLYNEKWNKIENINSKWNVNRNNSYVDGKGYLRWKNDDRLIHRDIAFQSGLRGVDKFGNCDVHHKDKNKLNNDPSNLEVLDRETHEERHGNVIFIDGKKYIKLARIEKIYRETGAAIMVARKWIPKSQCVFRDGFVYLTEWIWKQKGF